ncbi:hypothetical protein [Nitrosomonas nitrosa]|uniref:hypothetical protein n=1 Tax=Nitrosomonas nitrosa TaxID=52442 RepID=UPI000D31DCCA|nr:hypothetical protein [Nitrosomonas nitrosa]
MTGINHPAEYPVDLLVLDFAVSVFGKLRELFEEAFDFRPDLKAPAGVPFQPFGDNAGQRLITHQHLAVTGF